MRVGVYVVDAALGSVSVVPTSSRSGAAENHPSGVAGDVPRRPWPAESDDTRFFWDGARRGELRIQICLHCKGLRHPPRPMCPQCTSLDWDFIVSAGVGEVHSFVVHHRPVIPWMDCPFVVAVVALPEGIRVVTNVIGCAPEQVHVEMPVEVTFETYDDGLVLPQFRPTVGRAARKDPRR